MDRFEWGDKVIVRAYHIAHPTALKDVVESTELFMKMKEAGEILQTTLLCLVTHLSQLRKLMIAGDVMQLPPYNHELDPEEPKLTSLQIDGIAHENMNTINEIEEGKSFATNLHMMHATPIRLPSDVHHFSFSFSRSTELLST
ncbi:hypothetical protein QR680_014704 [Steinernema hermaphroditum]|uniref:Uncharacterized protein n=1 Tax=Steinernema hermaphroditum TaxID=289476 RepID=A0AA39I9U5_9BILA|nr:hypothetical protein QR680_014704 [Steinernema hermaphroditum]